MTKERKKDHNKKKEDNDEEIKQDINEERNESKGETSTSDYFKYHLEIVNNGLSEVLKIFMKCKDMILFIHFY